jgi:peptidoglycan-associated lipoprotein
MVDEELVTMAKFARFSRWGAVASVAALLALAGCAKDPNAAGGGGPSLGVAGSGAYGTAVPGSSQDFVANVGDRVFFDTNSTDITAQAKATLDAQIGWLNKYSSLHFTIEGHTDDRGTREYNIALGARRASNVKDYLVAHGVASSRIQTISYGMERPVATCDDPTCWAQNRRAVTVLSGPGT